MIDPIAWDLAEKVAVRVARHEPLEDSYLYATLQPDFEELTAQAEVLVEEATGLHSLAGPARARVTDRQGWVAANIASFQRLLRPVTERLGAAFDRSSPVGALQVPITRMGRNISGTQVGLLLGWMSTRVLGQYDQLIIEEESPEEQDLVYYVGPNILALEKRFAFPPREFRLWLALHEVTHRTQFTAVPWMRRHFLSLVESTLNSVNPDPRHLAEALRRAVDQVRQGQNPLEDGGLLVLLAGSDQFEVIRRVMGLMSLLEGHGDVIMDRAGEGRIPSAERFGRVLRQRRQLRGPARVASTLIGLEAKLRQYEYGERFIAEVEAAGGPELFATVWKGPEWLPSLAEVRDPGRWIERVRAGEPASELKPAGQRVP